MHPVRRLPVPELCHLCVLEEWPERPERGRPHLQMREPRVPPRRRALRAAGVSGEHPSKARECRLEADEPCGRAAEHQSEAFEQRERGWAGCREDVGQELQEERRGSVGERFPVRRRDEHPERICAGALIDEVQ